ncbi:hypothetical protein MIND_00799400 [Mycena indigotica]|uniref:Cytochrome P450 n=1 Tax=Mycena indigotica TaxID=2126181 RepID=A0A8H6SFF1_9AGAR|nr:uncharacterized protein MIND_00799400 [Mycena indigotica]KAF7298528.1 hypothetical protein MIND_00799400 [Mycena indigotica]
MPSHASWPVSRPGKRASDLLSSSLPPDFLEDPLVPRENAKKPWYPCASAPFTPMFFLLALVVLGGLLARFWRARRNNAVLSLRGPEAPSFVFGNMLQLQGSATYGEHEYKWLEEFGTVYPVKGCLGQTRLMISDPEALKYLLHNQSVSWASTQQKSVKMLFGYDSLFISRGTRHAHLRRIMNPWFSASSVRTMLPIMRDAAQRLVENWESQGFFGKTVDISPTLHTASMDVISETLLETPMHGLEGKTSLSQIQNVLIDNLSGAGNVGQLMEAVIPYIPDWLFKILLRLPIPGLGTLKDYHRVTDDLTMKLLAAKRAAGETSDRSFVGKLASANDFSRPWTGIKEKDIPVHVRSMLMAGDRTTGDTLSWAMYQIARLPEFQASLRKEARAAQMSGEEIDYDKLPLLNAFLYEILRYYPALPLADRIAVEDFVLPLSKPVITKSGASITQLPIQKGQDIYLALASYHRMKSIWGEDAHEFRPSRWMEAEPPGNGLGMGQHGALLAFLAGHGICIGYRLAMLNIQVLVSTLVAKFAFALPEDDSVRPSFVITLVPKTGDGKSALPVVVSMAD